MWTLDEALLLIRDLQPAVSGVGYHIALAGGVLNKGASNKDLDLIFLPLDTQVERVRSLLNLLVPLLGGFRALRDDTHYEPGNNSHYREMVAFNYLGKRIDAFIV